MFSTLQMFGAGLALVSVLLALLGSEWMRFAWGDRRPASWRFTWRAFWVSELGAVSVLYYIRGGMGLLINGSATPPTAIQANQCHMQKAAISFADTDTQALFTHNWGLDVSSPTYFDPEILGIAIQGPAQPAQTYLPAFTFDFSNTNVLKVNKLSFLGTGGTYLIGIRRPMSVGQ